MSSLTGYTLNFRPEQNALAPLYIHYVPARQMSVTIINLPCRAPFKMMKDGSVGPGDAIECPSVETAIVSAEILSRIEGTIGVAAFSRTGDTETGLFEDAVMLNSFGGYSG
jgi:hypothetical protein